MHYDDDNAYQCNGLSFDFDIKNKQNDDNDGSRKKKLA